MDDERSSRRARGGKAAQSASRALAARDCLPAYRHPVRAMRSSPVDLRTTGIGDWPFRVPRRSQITARCD
jgi:hypothetical protein